jgi:predicted nucleotidyltransferase
VGGEALSVVHLEFPDDSYRKPLVDLVKYFKGYTGVYAIVLTGSLARGKAVKGSCIDLFVFFDEESFKALASTVKSRVDAYSRLNGQICYYENGLEGGIEFGDVRVDVGFTDGKFNPCRENSFDITRDDFETTIGNLFVYSVVMYEKNGRYQQLKRKYLPFYDDGLRRARLNGTTKEFDYKMWKTRWLAKRGEHFAAFYALLEAHRILLQHLFIKERKYPIDYTKWLEEQCSRVLRMPNLYRELLSVMNGIELTENGIEDKSNLLESLFSQYCALPSQNHKSKARAPS